jgi:small subunit ribosomal protein S13
LRNLSKNQKKAFIFNFIFLLHNYVFNNKVIVQSNTFRKFIKNNYGLKRTLFNLIKLRFEVDVNQKIEEFSGIELKQFILLIYKIIPIKGSVYARFRLNIYLLDLATCYKGWRHYKGLPVNGQRTWSNGWTVYRNNNILRNLKLKNARKYYNNVPVKEGNVAYLAEYVNWL